MDLHASSADELRAIERLRFEECVATHEPRLLGRIGLMVRDPQEARDLVQETMVRAWQSWSTLRPDELGQWLDVVASRLALNEIRRRRRRPWSRLEGHELPADTTIDPDLWTALGELSRPERVVIVLAVIGGYTQAEIAAHLGVPLGTVSSWSTRGRQRLRAVLSNQEDTDAPGH
jgi:RNA polymerase sigma-70 factor (ECF subfamily)